MCIRDSGGLVETRGVRQFAQTPFRLCVAEGLEQRNGLPENAGLTINNTDPTTVTVPPGGVAVDNTGYVILRLAVLKTLSAGQSPQVSVGEDIRFTIIITNESVFSITNVTIVEHVPTGLAMSPSDTNGWVVAASGLTATNVIPGPVAPGAAAALEVVMRVVTAEQMTIVNLISVEMAGSGSQPPAPIGGVVSKVDVQINTPTAIDLINFYAVYENGMMLVNWATAWEQDTFGFHLYRGESESFEGVVQITEALIPGKGTGGGEYTYLDYVFADRMVTPNRTYWYWLQEIETTGDTNIYGPTRATATPLTVPDWSGSLFLPLINR